MAIMRRVNGPIKIMDKDFKVEGWYSATVMPLVMDQPAEVKGSIRHMPRYYLTAIDNEMVYLHEEAESVVPA
jgi:hypothetical protein